MKFKRIFILIILISACRIAYADNLLITPRQIVDNSRTNVMVSLIGYYPAFIYHVVDGDTVDAVVRIGFEFITYKRFRIYNLDTPETWRPSCDAERIHGEKAKEEAKRLLLNKYLIIRTGFDQGYYCRELADIYLPDGTNYSDYMKANGFSKRNNYKQ